MKWLLILLYRKDSKIYYCDEMKGFIRGRQKTNGKLLLLILYKLESEKQLCVSFASYVDHHRPVWSCVPSFGTCVTCVMLLLSCCPFNEEASPCLFIFGSRGKRK
jgi:hypothetical protein